MHGALKLFTGDCFEAVGGIQERLGWDTIDETYARMFGFETFRDQQLLAKHHRPSASADGKIRGRMRHGQCAYIARYSFPWVLARSLKVAIKWNPRGISGGGVSLGLSELRDSSLGPHRRRFVQAVRAGGALGPDSRRIGTRVAKGGLMHDLCVIIVSHNNKRWLRPALESVLVRSGPIDVDVVVVDNGTDGSAEHVSAEFPFVRTIRCENRGFGHANNRALETADARHVLFLNPDTEILEGTLSDLVAALDARPEVALIGVRQLRPDGTLSPTIRRFPSSLHTLAESVGVEHVPVARRFLGERELDLGSYERETECDWTSGSFMLVRGTALETVGWFDERFFLFSEETDLCWRLRGAGWRIVHMPSVTIYHVESDMWSNPRLAAQETYARMQLARKHRSDAGHAIYRLALGFRHLLRLALYSTLRRRKGKRQEAVLASLSMVFRNRAPLGPQPVPTCLEAPVPPFTEEDRRGRSRSSGRMPELLGS